MLDDKDHSGTTGSTPPAANVMDFDSKVESEYRSIVDDASNDGIKREDAIALAFERLKRRGVGLPADAFARSVVFVIDRADGRERHRTNDHLLFWTEVLTGDVLLDADSEPMAESVAIIGSGLRKTWRNVGADDLIAMAERRTRHAADAAVAASEFVSRIAPLLSALSKLGDDATLEGLL